jgi:hypothetical protein
MPVWLRTLSGAAALGVAALCLTSAGCIKEIEPKGSSRGTTYGKDADGKGVPGVTQANFDRIKDGMSEQEVYEILGKETDSYFLKGGEGRELFWKTSNGFIRIRTQGGRVDRKNSESEFAPVGNTNGVKKELDPKIGEKKG